MGDIVVYAFGGLLCVALGLVAVGLRRRSRQPLMAGSVILLALAGAWLIRPPGALLGVIPLLLLLRRRS